MLRTIALFLCVVGAVLGDLDLTILHTNDMHGRFDETSATSGTCKQIGSDKCYGGFARVAHVVREHRNASARNPAGPATLFLNAGDTYTGTSWFSVHKWKIAVDFINRLNPDCISFGNHEFDYGIAGIMPFLTNLKVPLVAANMDFSKDSQFTASIPKSHVLTVRGVRIGVIGYLLPDTKILSSTGNVTFFDEVESINTEAEKLDAEGVKVIIALGHSGFDTDKRIAKECPLVDLVVGGHTNTFLWNGQQPDSEVPEGPYPVLETQASGKVVPVVQAYAYTKYIGRLNITINDEGDVIKYEGQPILLTSQVPKVFELQEALDVYRPGLEAATKRVVGQSRVDLPIDKCRLEECNFGNLLADAYLEQVVMNYAGSSQWSDTSIAILNGGGFRSAVDSGEITSGEILGALPYDMNVISFRLTGADLLQTLETGIRSNGETSRGEFLQVSGLRITYDLAKPVGSRVVKVDVRCADCKVPVYQPLDHFKVYGIVSHDFILSGGDGYTVLRDKAFNRTIEDTNEIEIISNYIEKRRVIYPEVHGRITVLNRNRPGTVASAGISPRINALAILLSLARLCALRY